MKYFEYTLSKFPNSVESEKFKKRTRELLEKMSSLVLSGDEELKPRLIDEFRLSSVVTPGEKCVNP